MISENIVIHAWNMKKPSQNKHKALRVTWKLRRRKMAHLRKRKVIQS